MILNEFLGLTLDVNYDDKYNKLATEEIINNQDKYPTISEYFVEYMDQFEEGDEIDYDLGLFCCDDPEYYPSFQMAFELSRAFATALLKDVCNEKIRLGSISIGVDYLSSPCGESVFNGYLNYIGSRELIVRYNYSAIFDETFVPNYVKEDGENFSLGHLGSFGSQQKVYCDNEELLNNIKESLVKIANERLLDNIKFDDETLMKNVIKNYYEEENGYPFDVYTLSINDNYIKFYTTDRNNPLNELIRRPILNSLHEFIRDNSIIEKIR